MAITPLPTPPDKINDTVAEFTTKADAFLGALPTFGTEANALAVEMQADADAAAASASTATTKAGEAAAAASSAASAPGTSSNSTSSVTLGSGNKTFTVEAGKLWLPGMNVKVVDTVDTSRWMSGQVVSYSGTTLVVNSQIVSGAETASSSWRIFLSGTPGKGYVVNGGVKSASFTASAGFRYPVNTSSAAVTATLPETPADGDYVAFIDAVGTFNTYTLTVGNNSRKIMGLYENMLVTVKNAAFTLMYIADTDDWRIVEASFGI